MVKKLKKRELLVLLSVLLIFGLVVIGRFRLLPLIIDSMRNLHTQEKEIEWNYTCKSGEKQLKVNGGTICKDESVSGSVPANIFETYPLHPNGKEYIYQFINEGDIKIANDYLSNQHFVDRFELVKIEPPISWKEDTYSDKYWRFIFYSLRSTGNLVFAWNETGNPAYKDKLIEILNSFLDNGIKQEHSWDDNHGVAFRTMVLVNTWWKLREHNGLPEELSTKILIALKRHGDFLADRNHYEPQYNHGINEAAALLLLAKSFPDLEGSDKWLKIAEERLNTSVISAVDEDGVLVENSPYYHFYALEKYWEIFKYTKKFDQAVGQNFEQKINKMIDYATYILQPNQEIPLLGASLERKIRNSGIDKEISQLNQNFLYVLTRGRQGKKPANLNVHYSVAGQTILRSGWTGESGFTGQTQLIFDIGPFRTLHSHLDALSFSLYGNGLSLIPDSGLYTYDDGLYKNYFRGTYAHNTVVVDGQDQKEGTAVGGNFLEGDGYSYQSAEHELYDGVKHERAITLLGKNLVLITDNLSSQSFHTYEQLFHLFPGAKLTTNNLNVEGLGNSENQSIRIHQIVSKGISVNNYLSENNPVKGVCSVEYGKLIPCYTISYSQKGTNVNYYTLLEIGKKNPDLKYNISKDLSRIDIRDGKKEYLISISHTQNIAEKVEVTKNNTPKPKGQLIDNFSDLSQLVAKNLTNNGEQSIHPSSVVGRQDNAMTISSKPDGSWIEVSKKVNLNLKDRNLLIRMNIEKAGSVTGLELGLSSNDWKGYAVNLLSNAYRAEYSGEWMSISLGKGENRDRGGQWTIYGQGFNWENISDLRFRIKSAPGKIAKLKVSDISYIPSQKEGQVIIVFDDGYASILPAADLMNQLGIKGNVAIISGNVDKKNKSSLSLQEIIHLQNDYGWNIVNHSWYHKDALNTYYQSNKLNDFEKDILKGAKYLEDNGISTDPNWYIYPHGETNQKIRDIIGKYYKFARTIQNEPEVFPFGENLAVKSFSVENSTPPQAVIKAIVDAKKYKLTLFLTFHRIQSNPTDKPGYTLENLISVMNALKKQNISVKTLKEFDVNNGVEIGKINFIAGKPEQITLKINVKTGLYVRIRSKIESIKTSFENLFNEI